MNETRQNMQRSFSKSLFISLYFVTFLAFFYPGLGVMQLCEEAEICRICRHGRQNCSSQQSCRLAWQTSIRQMPIKITKWTTFIAKSAIQTLVVEIYESATQVQVRLQQGHKCLQSRSTLSGFKDTECRAPYKEPRSHIRTIGHSGNIAPSAMGQTLHHGPSCQIAPSADLPAKLIGRHHSRDQASAYRP